MALDTKLFTEPIDTGLKADPTFNKFYIAIKVNNKRKRMTLDYSSKTWSKRDRIAKARGELEKLREGIKNSTGDVDNSTPLDKIAELYFATRENTDWTKEIISIYNAHISKVLGNKPVGDIKATNIDALISKLRKKGAAAATKNGCSNRTIQKITKNVLGPILKYAYESEIIPSVPAIRAPKLENTKKLVDSADVMLKDLYNAIMELYADEPLYRAFFLFALFGRRAGEILKLEWTDVNFRNNTYIVRAENNKVKRDQSYALSPVIKEALEEFKDSKGIIFVSSRKPDQAMLIPRKQVSRLGEAIGKPDLNLHYFRNVYSSYLVNQPGITPQIAAAALGHLDFSTTMRHYASIDHMNSSQKALESATNLLKPQEDIIDAQIEGSK